jgi:osmoprotectant transport system ATP-binding protein
MIDFKALSSSAVSVEMRDVGKRFGSDSRWAVGQLYLTVHPGEVCVLVGPSGCGKTTALRMINRLVEPTTGDVLIDGEPAGSFEASALRRRIGYVIQQVGLLPHLSVAANVAVVPRMLGWKRHSIDTRIDEMLDLVGLSRSRVRRTVPSGALGWTATTTTTRLRARKTPLRSMRSPT